MERIVVVGASAGGIPALQTIISQLPHDFPSPILVVVHVPDGHESVLPRMLMKSGVLEAVHPYNGEHIQAGKIYVAPPKYHMVMIDHHVQLKNTPKENRHRPAIDPLFRSAAKCHGRNVIGVILSGVLDDGTGGLIEIKEQNGVAIVQDPKDATFSSMPESACRYVDVDYILPAHEIGACLAKIVYEAVADPEHVDVAETSAQNTIDITDQREVMLHNLHDQPGELTPYACPECNGNLWVSVGGGFEKYWCHIGHRYTKRILLAEKLNKAEDSLFEALRDLKEAAALGRETLDELAASMDVETLEELRKEVQLREKQLQSLGQMIEKS